MSDIRNKISNFFKLPDEDDDMIDDIYGDDDFSEEEIRKEERRMAKEQKNAQKSTRTSRFSSNASRDDYDYETEDEPVAAPKRQKPVQRTASRSKVVQMAPSANEMELCIVKPTTQRESQEVCSLLMDNHPVVVNFEGIDIMEAQRIMDFIAGCIFAIDGNMCQVSKFIFIFSPNAIDLTGDYIKRLEETESYNIASFNNKDI